MFALQTTKINGLLIRTVLPPHTPQGAMFLRCEVIMS